MQIPKYFLKKIKKKIEALFL